MALLSYRSEGGDVGRSAPWSVWHGKGESDSCHYCEYSINGRPVTATELVPARPVGLVPGGLGRRRLGGQIGRRLLAVVGRRRAGAVVLAPSQLTRCWRYPSFPYSRPHIGQEPSPNEPAAASSVEPVQRSRCSSRSGTKTNASPSPESEMFLARSFCIKFASFRSFTRSS
jgi:hypothetical protein